jgi:hypothetical protein
LEEEIDNNNNNSSFNNFNDYNTKFKLLEYELKKMRSEKENIVEHKKLLQNLKDRINKEKEELSNNIKLENQKIEKLSSINIRNLDTYDRLRISMTDKEKDKEMILPPSIDNFNIDIEKYLNNNGDGKNQNQNYTTKDLSNLDEKELTLEIQKLKARYEEKSKKYKKIIRKLKDVIANTKKSVSYSYNNSMGMDVERSVNINI